jgi:hypothetical protein
MYLGRSRDRLGHGQQQHGQQQHGQCLAGWQATSLEVR